ncbi:hypothetical protein QBC46DRAFT_458793 [Diplogelasinospora grovesii]|uniref:Protection of telomeres protein 1 n=1 Tax=Diplogelasinospora grovesii TaxID=303347 RepID=A0AAN6N8U5_9PEZI|nr:hypothetical protein QBC46DRAFT_458793 [Diplogelasinospora grovesii]
MPSSPGRTKPQLPPSFIVIRDILDESIPPYPGKLIDVIGVVKDHRLPVPTNGTDFKAALTLYDLTTQDGDNGIVFNIFRPEAEMPQVSAGDVVMIFQVKVQRFRSDPISLISSRYTTCISVYSAPKIPKPPASAEVALLPHRGHFSRGPNSKENEYASYFYHEIDKDFVPDPAEFQKRAATSLNIKQKFSLLKDVREGNFYDLIVQICREPFVFMDRVTLYVSDYTENDQFFHYTWEGVKDLANFRADPYGYTGKRVKEKKSDWVGPYGKNAIQITCWEPHANLLKSEGARAGEWLFLRNVQIKFGRDGTNLEGFLRGDHNKINVDILDTTTDADAETLDPRLKEGIRRWRDYTKQKKSQIKQITKGRSGLGAGKAGRAGRTGGASRERDTESGSTAGGKRKASELSEGSEKTLGTKEKRKLKREALQKKEDELRKERDRILGFNDQITCESHTAEVTPLSSILEPLTHNTTDLDGTPIEITLPFTCAKYRTMVRVVDFFPDDLEDFAVPRKHAAWELVSDNGSNNGSDDGSGSGSDSDESMNGGGGGGGRLTWEWRFALLLEDPTPKPGRQQARVWVVVDNPEAQCLTQLDAANLREDPHTLDAFREKMFTLWGNLEEIKAARREKAEKKRMLVHTRVDGIMRLEKPPLESSDNEDDDEREGRGRDQEISNKPFKCCIKQFGIQVREKDEERMNAGRGGKRWERCFGLFGTKIC